MTGVAGIALAVIFMSTNLAMAADSTMKANMPAQAQTVKGTTKETLLPARWPQFVEKDITWDAACGKYIAKENVDQTEGTVATTGLSLAPIYLRSSYAPDVKAGDKAEYTDLKGLRIEKYAVPEEYRTGAKIIVSWTMQVLGNSPSAAEQSETLPADVCPGAPTSQTVEDSEMFEGESKVESFSYTVHRKFPAGFQVNTRLWVKPSIGSEGVKGTVFSISMPEGADLEKEITYTITTIGTKPRYTPSEPTLTGTVILQPSDFEGGKLPATLDLQVQWINDSPLTVYTPENSRQMTVTIVPLNAQVS